LYFGKNYFFCKYPLINNSNDDLVYQKSYIIILPFDVSYDTIESLDWNNALFFHNVKRHYKKLIEFNNLFSFHKTLYSKYHYFDGSKKQIFSLFKDRYVTFYINFTH